MVRFPSVVRYVRSTEFPEQGPQHLYYAIKSEGLVNDSQKSIQSC